MIPEPRKDNTLLVVVGLIVILIIATVIYVYSASPSETEDADQWVAEGTEVLSPNATAIILKHENCVECSSAENIVNGIKQDENEIGTRIVEVRTVYDSSEEGRNMITRYNITKLPAIVLQKEGQWDSRMLSIWFSEMGDVTDDSSLVYRNVVAPYYDTTTDSVRGIIDIIYITDAECAECYNVTLFVSDMVTVFRLYTGGVSEYDVSSVEGSAIVSKYNITMVPTFLVSEDASLYPGFEEFWFRYESTEGEDGWYVFRDVDKIEVEYVMVNPS